MHQMNSKMGTRHRFKVKALKDHVADEFMLIPILASDGSSNNNNLVSEMLALAKSFCIGNVA